MLRMLILVCVSGLCTMSCAADAAPGAPDERMRERARQTEPEAGHAEAPVTGPASGAQRQRLIDAYLAGRLRPVEAAEQALLARYAELVALLGPREYRVALILARDEHTLRRAYERAVAGESFDGLARELSQAPSAARGGDLGWTGFPLPVSPGRTNGVPFELAVLLPQMSAGDISLPVPLAGSWAMVRFEAVRDTVVPGFDSVREQIAELYRRESLIAQARALGAGLFREATAVDAPGKGR